MNLQARILPSLGITSRNPQPISAIYATVDADIQILVPSSVHQIDGLVDQIEGVLRSRTEWPEALLSCAAASGGGCLSRPVVERRGPARALHHTVAQPTQGLERVNSFIQAATLQGLMVEEVADESSATSLVCQSDPPFSLRRPKARKPASKDGWLVDLQLAIENARMLIQSIAPSATTSGRFKCARSVENKFAHLGSPVAGVFDLVGIRVLVETIEQCFLVVGTIHVHFPHLEAQYDDYITQPKPNGYQSLHTVILDGGGCPIEVQVRTRAMHRCAESGTAAHPAYKAERYPRYEVAV